MAEIADTATLEALVFADDRASAIKKSLTPNSEEFFFHKALLEQVKAQEGGNQNLQAAKAELDAYNNFINPPVGGYSRSSIGGAFESLKFRHQALAYASASSDEKKAIVEQWIKDFNENFYDQKPNVAHGAQDEKSGPKYSSTLDTKTFDLNTLLTSKMPQSNLWSTYDRFALPWLASQKLSSNLLHDLLVSLGSHDVDLKNLPELIAQHFHNAAVSKRKRSFGDLPIDNLLTKQQLDRLAVLVPEVKNESRFVDLILTKMQPTKPIQEQTPEEKQAHWAESLKFVDTLAPGKLFKMIASRN